MSAHARDEAIAALYAQLDVPTWAARNLDALADVLRDLSWLPEGPVELRVPAGADARVLAVLSRAVRETADGPRAVHVRMDAAPHTG
ncbi:barstar family protein [uncultured Jatrophihabitans sp.]|uniref:barstar family protein n=1 Tax=uncultured Jatrophihabitans sp. TaxID=1610747 RepID=UPI0035CBA9E6